jgi:hypothetical protein
MFTSGVAREILLGGVKKNISLKNSESNCEHFYSTLALRVKTKNDWHSTMLLFLRYIN